MIKVGDHLPAQSLTLATPEGPKESSVEALFSGRRVAMFAVPGAFTPTCSARHVPGYVEHQAALHEKGIAAVLCLAVNDPFVLRAWAQSQPMGDIQFVADGSATFTRALGLELDLTARGLGVRSQRFVLVAEDGVVTHLAVEQPGDFDVSRAEVLLEALA